MGSHNFMLSWLMALMNVQFSQHHTVHQLKLPVDAKGLRWLVDRGVLETVWQNKWYSHPPTMAIMIPLINITVSVSICNVVLQGFTSFPKSRNHLKILGA